MKKSEKFTHGYLFYGLEGTGKKLAATELIEKITGRNLVQEDIFSGKIEDITLLLPCEEEKKGKKIVKDISIERARQAAASLNFFPAKLSRRFLVVVDAERLNLAAANSLLKVVEEPPSKAVIIFLANNLEKILPTLRSRLQKKFLSLLSKEEMTKFLKEKSNSLDEKRLEKVARLSYGRIVLAEKYLSDEILMLTQEQKLNQFRLATKGGLIESFALAEELAKDKNLAFKAVDNWVFYLRGFLMEKIQASQLGVRAEKKMVFLIRGLLEVKEKLNRPSANARLIWENFFLSIA